MRSNHQNKREAAFCVFRIERSLGHFRKDQTFSKKSRAAMAKPVSPGLSQVTDLNRPLVRSCTCSGAVPGDVTFFLPTLGHCSLQTQILMNSQMKGKEACFQRLPPHS